MRARLRDLAERGARLLRRFASRNDILLAVIASAAKQSRSSYLPQGANFRLPSLIGDAEGRWQADSIRRTLQRLCLDCSPARSLARVCHVRMIARRRDP